MMQLDELNKYLSEMLTPEQFKDYCPNGLQVEGRTEVNKIVTGVTASLALLEQAIARDADAIIVHHGYFWRGEAEPVIGMKKRRLQTLLKADVSLFAYHLPLDAHPEVGNNVMLGQQLGLPITRWIDPQQNMIAVSDLNETKPLHEIAQDVQQALGRQPQVLGDPAREIRSVAWCTGAAQSMMDKAIAAEVDLFITGEVSEQTFHMVQESNTAFMAAGHHATERYGVKALGEHLANKHGIQCEFLDLKNPI